MGGPVVQKTYDNTNHSKSTIRKAVTTHES